MRKFLLIWMALAVIEVINGDCDACIDRRCYSKRLIIADTVTSLSQAIDRTTNTLYYTSTETINRETVYHVKSYNLDNNSVAVITTANVANYAVDQATRTIYVTQESKKGVYKIDLNTKELVLSALANDEVIDIQYKDKLYYTDDSVQSISVLENGTSRVVPGTEGYNIESFIVDKKGDIYFRNGADFENWVICRLKSGERNVTEFCEWLVPTTDRDGNAFFIDENENSIYRVNMTGQITEIGAVSDSVIEALFDRDNNMVYREAYDMTYYHLKPQNNTCTTGIGAQNTRTILPVLN